MLNGAHQKKKRCKGGRGGIQRPDIKIGIKEMKLSLGK